jgi:hypothetical protein
MRSWWRRKRTKMSSACNATRQLPHPFAMLLTVPREQFLPRPAASSKGFQLALSLRVVFWQARGKARGGGSNLSLRPGKYPCGVLARQGVQPGCQGAVSDAILLNDRTVSEKVQSPGPPGCHTPTSPSKQRGKQIQNEEHNRGKGRNEKAARIRRF